MWRLQTTEEYERRLKKWPKKYRRELVAMLGNLDTVVQALNQGATVSTLRFGFLHHEPLNVKAVDQKGGGAGLKESRLYFFASEDDELFHLLTVGDKQSQPDDIRWCSEYVKDLINE